MGMKTTLLAGAVAVGLFSTAAFAQSYAPAPPSGVAFGVSNGGYYDDGYGPRRGGVDRDGDGDVDRRDRRGRYELRNVQQWVPGQMTQVYVPGACVRSPSGFAQICSPGRYETRQGPGYYRTVQQWVWVPFDSGHRWGRHGRR